MKKLSYWINPKYLYPGNIIKYRKEFYAKELVKIIKLDNFFNDYIINRIITELKQKKAKFEFNDSYENWVVDVDFFLINQFF